MKETIVYLIRHADTVKEDGIRNTNEDSQMINEKEILSIDGEKQSESLSKIKELRDIDVIWSSNYTRAKATAKYIAYENNISVNLDSMLCERKLGNLDELAIFMKNKKTRDPSQEQLLDTTFKTSNGESAEDTNKRMNIVLNKMLNEYSSKKIAIVSHGGAIKFYLLNWCSINEDVKLVYKDKILDITSPCLLKLTFIENKLIDLEQLK